MRADDTAEAMARLIDDLIVLCRRFDPAFDERAPSYSASPFRLSLDGVPEADIERVAAEFGRAVSRPLDFAVGSGTPNVHASVFVSIGSLSVFLCAKRRPPTPAELAHALAEIHRSANRLGQTPEAPTAEVITNGDHQA